MALRVTIQQAEAARSRGALKAALRARLRRAARAALEAMEARDAEISITLLDDEGMTGMNERYLGHDGPTDILSFALHGPGEAPLGDIYIGADQAERNAAALGIDVSEEFARLAVHGTLHVLGLDHPDDETRESSEMWQLQERILETVLNE